MKKLSFLLILTTLLSFGINAQVLPEQTQRTDEPTSFIDCNPKKVVGLLDFHGDTDPYNKVLCNTLGTLSWERVGIGVYLVSIPGGFDENKTWVYLQSYTSVTTELQILVMPSGHISFQSYFNGVLTDIIAENISYEIRVF